MVLKYCIVLRRYIWGVVLYRVHGKRDSMWTAGGMYTNIRLQVNEKSFDLKEGI